MSARVLVLEDDDFLRNALVEALEDEDYEVYQAADAQQAANTARRQDLDLVVADVRLGEVDGIEFLAQLRRFAPKVRSIVMTGYASNDAPARALKVQAEDYIYKPFELDDLLDAVERVLGAEDEKEKYRGLFGGIKAGYEKLKGAAGAALASAELKALEAPRDLCFSAFYVGVRSRKLNQKEAAELWGRIEALEQQRQELLKGASQLGRGKALAKDYDYVRELIAAVSRTSLEFRGQQGSSCPAELFAHLFAQLGAGAVSAEQLKQAPVVRTLDPLTLSQSEPLSQLFRCLWGATPES